MDNVPTGRVEEKIWGMKKRSLEPWKYIGEDDDE
jgi:hypothetical protein